MKILAILCTALLCGCLHSPPFADASREAIGSIAAAVARSEEATRTQNVDDYMEILSEGFVLHEESGAVVTRDQFRAKLLHDWSLVVRTLDVDAKIITMKLRGDTATVATSRRWERLVLGQDGQTDVALTAQRHGETWRLTADGWKLEDAVERETHTWVNSKPATP